MSNSEEKLNTEKILLYFKIGVLKELHRRELLTKEERDKAIKYVEYNYLAKVQVL